MDFRNLPPTLMGGARHRRPEGRFKQGGIATLRTRETAPSGSAKFEKRRIGDLSRRWEVGPK